MRAFRAPVAFDGSRFLDGGATVVVDGSQIVRVESFAHELPADVPVTSCDGTLLPGLFDCHAHLVADGTPGNLERVGGLDDDQIDAVISASLTRQAAAGVTTVRDLGDRNYRTLAARDEVATGVPRVVAAGPPLTIPDGHCHYLGGVAEGPDAIRAAVAERAARGVDVVKVMATGGMLTPGTDVMGVQFAEPDLRLLVEVAHEAGLQVLAHAHSLSGAWTAVRAGVDGIEHFTCLAGEGIVMPDELLAAVAAAGVVVDPTYGFDPQALAQIVEVPPPMQALLQKLNLTREALFERRIESAARFRAHGVQLVSGLDSGTTPLKAHGNVWRAVTALVWGGYPVDEALVTGTSGAAGACGLGDVTGRLSPGLEADLLVVDGDLRSDPDALGRPVAVLVRGEQPVAH